ncbi:hypothetical protein DTO063F5_6430 [Paecilomyces variotii]|nr:hypothetical protein DTO063F5_6430 [Paecilomyces variotii]
MEKSEYPVSIPDEDYISCPFQKTLESYFAGDAMDQVPQDNAVEHTSTDESGMPFPEPTDPIYHKTDPNGDIILVLNMICPDTNEQTKMKLQVSSSFLASGSPVFQTMFTGGFEEAHRLRENVTSGIKTEIYLPEDNAEAMKELCEVIHHRETKSDSVVPRSLDSVWETIILAQKYDCLRLVVDRFDCYLYRTQKWINSTDMEATVKILVMSSLLGNNIAFRGASEVIIENSTWSLTWIRRFAQRVGAPLDIDRLCDEIEKIREEHLSRIYQGIQDIGTYILRQGHIPASQEGSTRLSTTECRAARWLALGETMDSVGMSPYERNGNIKDILRKIKKCGSMKIGGCIGRKCKCKAPDLGSRMVRMVNSIHIKGLELSDFRTKQIDKEPASSVLRIRMD